MAGQASVAVAVVATRSAVESTVASTAAAVASALQVRSVRRPRNSAMLLGRAMVPPQNPMPEAESSCSVTALLSRVVPLVASPAMFMSASFWRASSSKVVERLAFVSLPSVNLVGRPRALSSSNANDSTSTSLLVRPAPTPSHPGSVGAKPSSLGFWFSGTRTSTPAVADSSALRSSAAASDRSNSAQTCRRRATAPPLGLLPLSSEAACGVPAGIILGVLLTPVGESVGSASFWMFKGAAGVGGGLR